MIFIYKQIINLPMIPQHQQQKELVKNFALHFFFHMHAISGSENEDFYCPLAVCCNHSWAITFPAHSTYEVGPRIFFAFFCFRIIEFMPCCRLRYCLHKTHLLVENICTASDQLTDNISRTMWIPCDRRILHLFRYHMLCIRCSLLAPQSSSHLHGL